MSRSSSGRTRPGASSFCPGAGWSNEPSPGSAAAAGEPGTPEFEASYRGAVEQRKASRHGSTLAGLAAAYRGSPEFANRAASTLKEWSRFLDLIQAADGELAIGSLPVEALAAPRVRQHLLAWRDQWRSTPRKADYAMQVLSAVLSWAVDRGTLPVNVLLGHNGLYQSDRSDQIWSDEEIRRFIEAAPSPEVGFIVRLACLTGLRRGDLLRLENGIRSATSQSSWRRARAAGAGRARR